MTTHVLYSGLLRSMYCVSPIPYRRYFFNISKSIANAFEKSISRVIANTFLTTKKSILFTNTFSVLYRF